MAGNTKDQHESYQQKNQIQNTPLSPIIDGYVNTLNSENIIGGFVTSTQKERAKSPSVLPAQIKKSIIAKILDIISLI